VPEMLAKHRVKCLENVSNNYLCRAKSSIIPYIHFSVYPDRKIIIWSFCSKWV